MAKFIKHIGKQGDRKVAVIFRQIPGEDHMCLVVYTETMNQNIHDPLMSTIESDIGQTSENLGDALNRSYTKDGQIILQMLHREGMMKKVQTNQIVMTPSPNQQVRLSELNDILNEMSKGEDAVKRLAEMDSSRGLQDPKDVARRMKNNRDAQAVPTSVMGDSDLAQQRLTQAQRMASEAQGLLAESQRLTQEAYAMDPALNPDKPVKVVRKSRTSKTIQAASTEAIAEASEPVAKVSKAGRPRKAAVAG